MEFRISLFFLVEQNLIGMWINLYQFVATSNYIVCLYSVVSLRLQCLQHLCLGSNRNVQLVFVRNCPVQSLLSTIKRSVTVTKNVYNLTSTIGRVDSKKFLIVWMGTLSASQQNCHTMLVKASRRLLNTPR